METEEKLIELLSQKISETDPMSDHYDDLDLIFKLLSIPNYSYGHAASILDEGLSPRQKIIKSAHELLDLPYP